ncbi:hypothetical protein CLOSTASPAR_01642 [[Clostridium] asparagiforme DSM 15981]|uniref:Uncharacterized protein n=1 Tax=[Clostridium] asparagiforme DSM 15981 TaxID=518636 RepID=C0CXC1_9FIRM|nr:hypothetical protein CLOSTASPAR_01642 [[Clostridium] asparagiforme DSM 15981]
MRKALYDFSINRQVFINILLIFLTVAPSIFTFEDSADSILCIKGRNDLCCC